MFKTIVNINHLSMFHNSIRAAPLYKLHILSTLIFQTIFNNNSKLSNYVYEQCNKKTSRIGCSYD